MKTIATAAVLMMLAAPAWADDAEKQTKDPVNTHEPIVLSEAVMDGVTAGEVKTGDRVLFGKYVGTEVNDGDARVFQSYALYPHMNLQ